MSKLAKLSKSVYRLYSALEKKINEKELIDYTECYFLEIRQYSLYQKLLKIKQIISFQQIKKILLIKNFILKIPKVLKL